MCRAVWLAFRGRQVLRKRSLSHGVLVWRCGSFQFTHPGKPNQECIYFVIHSNFYFIFLSFLSPISFFLFSLLFPSLSFLLLLFPFSPLLSLPPSFISSFLCFPPSLLFLCLWGSHSVDDAVLKFLVIFLLQSSKNWDYRHVQL